MMMNHPKMFGQLIILISCAAAAAVPPEYDARALRPLCAAWHSIMNQGSVASCCSFAMASALSVRECLRDGRDTLYSSQQIWDCSGPSLSDAQNGTLLQGLIGAMGDVSSPHSAYFLVPHACAPAQLLPAAPSLQRCADTFNSCVTGVILPPVEASATFRLSTFSGPRDYGVILAARYMMVEIMQNGPVIAVLALANLMERLRFETLQPNTVFSPNEAASPPSSLHCIVVYGWGQDGATGVRFWRVQNSYGPEWSDGGVGRIARGTLERDWRSVSTPSRRCAAAPTNSSSAGNSSGACIYPPAWEDPTYAADYDNTTTVAPPQQHNYYYYPNFDLEKAKARYLHLHPLPLAQAPAPLLAISNEIIIVISVASSLVIGGILFAIIKPLRITPRAQQIYFSSTGLIYV